MNNEQKKDLILGMCYAIASHFERDFNVNQQRTFAIITSTIDEIYYPNKDLSKPTTRGE